MEFAFSAMGCFTGFFFGAGCLIGTLDAAGTFVGYFTGVFYAAIGFLGCGFFNPEGVILLGIGSFFG